MKKLIVTKKRVLFYIKNDITNEAEFVTLKQRYAILPRSRWSLLYDFMKNHFIQYGQKGCYVGETRDNEGNICTIWDLSKIFPNTAFEYNDISKYKLI